MRLLLDTHVALWAITDDARLTQAARSMIADAANTILVSAVSIWEIAIKYAIRRGSRNDMPIGAAEATANFVKAGYVMLPITPRHACAIETLPRMHPDPFDRMLLAQAMTEPAWLLTRDAKLHEHGAMTIAI